MQNLELVPTAAIQCLQTVLDYVTIQEPTGINKRNRGTKYRRHYSA